MRTSASVFGSGLLLALAISVSEGTDSAPADVAWSQYPYTALVTETASGNIYVGLVVARLYFVVSKTLMSSQVTVTFGDPLDSASPTLTGDKIYTDSQISVLKVCAMVFPTQVYKLTPSLFSNFGGTEDIPAKYIYFNDEKKLKSVDTFVLPDAQCPAEILDETAPAGVTYNSTKHSCLLSDCSAVCQWTAAVNGKTAKGAALVVDNQVVAFFLDGTCSATFAWASTRIFNKILPSRDYVMATTRNRVISP